MSNQTAVSRFFLGLLLIGVLAAIVVVACSRDSDSPDDSDVLVPATVDFFYGNANGWIHVETSGR